MTGASRVFVSHANLDKRYVDGFVNCILMRGAGLRPEQIFYSSETDTGIPSGRDLMASVRKEAGDTQLVVALVTPVYQTRPVCVAELGAAWGRDVLFPLMAPEMNRSELEGVLPGLVIRSAAEGGALDELSDRIKSLGFNFTASSWGVGKDAWLSSLQDGLRPAAVPLIPTVEQMKRLETDLKRTQAALEKVKTELQEQIDRNTKLRMAKTPAEVQAANLPSGEDGRFKVVQRTASQALRKLTPVVKEAVWYEISGEEMYQPSPVDAATKHEAIREEARNGRLKLDDDGTVTLVTEYPGVGEALVAAQHLSDFLNPDDRSEDFASWFKQKFEAPMDLTRKGCWDAIL